MTIGKRKGIAAKGAHNPAQPGDKVGGSLSKGDHWYIQQAFGIAYDPGIAGSGIIEATGGVTGEYTAPTGKIFKSHTFYDSGTFTVSSINQG